MTGYHNHDVMLSRVLMKKSKRPELRGTWAFDSDEKDKTQEMEMREMYVRPDGATEISFSRPVAGLLMGFGTDNEASKDFAVMSDTPVSLGDCDGVVVMEAPSQ